MKTAYLLMLIPALASATAFAQGTQGTQGTSDTSSKRTTAQVRQELIEAKHDGTYARGNAGFRPASKPSSDARMSTPRPSIRTKASRQSRMRTT
jgi:hypothetical protein